jgi:hypothetical protein
MLPDQDKGSREVFEAFGYAAFWACLWEMQMVALADTIYWIKNPKTTQTERSQFDASLRKKPVGQWTKRELKDFFNANPKSLNFFQKNTDERNWLIHHFYEEQIPNLNSEAGRKFAVKELDRITNKLKAGQAIVRESYMTLAKRHFRNIDEVLDKARKRAEKIGRIETNERNTISPN